MQNHVYDLFVHQVSYFKLQLFMNYCIQAENIMWLPHYSLIFSKNLFKTAAHFFMIYNHTNFHDCTTRVPVVSPTAGACVS
jgi:hypothetical protein